MSSNSSLDTFCGSSFWDLNLTWYTENPTLTPCFERTVMVWAPCAFLWLFSALEAYNIVHSKFRNIPWGLLNITKYIITAMLALLMLVDLAYMFAFAKQEVYDAEYYASIVKLVTFVLAATLVHYNKQYGMQASAVLFFFWLLLALAGMPQLRTEITRGRDTYTLVSYSIYYCLVLIMFLLNCFADLSPQDTLYTDYEKQKHSEKAAGIPSRLAFSWFDPLALTGYRRTLVESDLWQLDPEDSSKEIVPLFDMYWRKTQDKREKSKNTKAAYTKDSELVDIQSKVGNKPISIVPVLFKSFGSLMAFASCLKLANTLLTFLSPLILKAIIAFVKSSEPVWKGYLYAVLLLVCAMVQTLFLVHDFKLMYHVGMRARTALTSAVYRKSLRMSNSAKQASTQGEIVNLMAVDAQRFLEASSYFNLVWAYPLQILISVYLLWYVLGPAVLAGLSVLIILIPINAMIANKEKFLQVQQMKYKDERIKLMNEILNGIKVLKIYAWEPCFEEQIMKIRNKETKILIKIAYLNSATAFLGSCAPFLVSLMSFGCFVLINDKEVLDSERAFVALSLFNLLRYPLQWIPTVVSSLVQLAVSIKRLNNFLNCQELDLNAVDKDPKEMNTIVVEKGFFSWNENDDTPVLSDVNFSVPNGALVAVVGPVGAGKSSLLSALLGDMSKISGRVNILGDVAYVPQQAWIQNATLQDNILFGREMKRRKYEKVVNVCALRPDFDMLPGGDQTEIGEKGINMSGGQKQRVSLARAVYNDADIYFLDDPLSAVDSHVGKHIFEKVIGPSGSLKSKTRVWVTHNVSYLAQTDLVIVLKDGSISEVGTYQQLLDRKGAFAEFLLHHLSDAETATPEEYDSVKDDIVSKFGDEFENKIQRARSLSESLSEKSGASSLSRLNSITRNMSDKNKELQDKEAKEKHKLIGAEKSEAGNVKWAVYKHYFVNVGLTATIITVVMNLLMQLLQVGANFWLVAWSNDKDMIVNGTQDIAKRDMYLGVYGGFGIGQVIAVSMSSLSLSLGALAAAKALQIALLSGVLRSPVIGFFDCTPVGRILNRFSKDVDVLDNVLPTTLRNWTAAFFSVLGTVLVITISTPIAFPAIIPIGLLYYGIQRFYVATSRQLKRMESVTRSPIYSHFGESISGASVIRAYNYIERFVEESEKRVDRNQQCYYPNMIANRWLAVRLEMIGNLIVFIAAVFGVYGRDTLSSGIVGLSVSYAMQITPVLNWLVRMSSDVETNIVAVERIKEYADNKQESAWLLPEGPGPKWPESGSVQMDGVTLGYRIDSEPALREISCVISPKEKIGIVGRTGAGKSTLTLGLFRIVELLKGRIVIDGIDISKIGLHQLRSRITVIPQDPVLFSGTLRMNLDPYEAYSDSDVWKALEHAHLKAFAENFGLSHPVVEGGENLSVGQRQLVCLARALLRKTSLLILDEATAAVDLETDDLIQKTIRSEFASCTVLTIAHRLNTIMDSTRVMVLDQGRLVEFAPPEQLLKDKETIFYGMAKDAGLVN